MIDGLDQSWPEQLDSVENEVIEGTIGSLVAFLRAKDAKIAGHTIELRGGHVVELVTEVVDLGKCLAVHFQPRTGRREALTKARFTVLSAGRLHAVELVWSAAVARILSGLPEHLSRHVEHQYAQLEAHFLAAYGKAYGLLLEGVHGAVQRHLTEGGAEELGADLTPTVSRLPEIRFKYYLTEEAVRAQLQRFKAARDPVHSPLALILALVLGEAGHTINVLMHDFAERRALYLPTDSFMSKHEDLGFYVAESALLGNKELAEYTICSTRGHVFQLGMPRDLEAVLRPICDAMQPVLKALFIGNLERFSRAVRAIPGARRGFQRSTILLPMPQGAVQPARESGLHSSKSTYFGRGSGTGAASMPALIQFIESLIADFRHYVEVEGGWILFRDDNGEERPERVVQDVFAIVARAKCAAAGVILSREVQLGVGRIDFTLSSGFSQRVHIEVKKLEHPRFWRGLRAQLPAYLKSDDVTHGWLLVVRLQSGDRWDRRVAQVQRAIKNAGRRRGVTLHVALVDGRVQQMASRQ